MNSTLRSLPLVGESPRPRSQRGVAERRVPTVGAPDSLQVEITSSCNLKCIMCPLTLGSTLSSHDPGHMKEMVWEQVLEAAKHVEWVCVVGFGEPTTNPRCLSMLGDLDRMQKRFTLSTNAYSLRKEFVEGLAQFKHLKHVNVSIDSPDPKVFFDIRKGDLDRVWDGLRLLANGLPSNVSLTVTTVLMESNVATLAAFPAKLHEVGVKKFVMGGMYDLTSQLGDQQVDDDEFGVHLDNIKSECKKYGIEVHCDLSLDDFKDTQSFYLGNWGTEHKTKQCLLPWLYPFMDKNGDIFPCCYGSGDRAAVMGNINEENMEEIWEGERFQRFRQDLLSGDDMPAICHNCSKPAGQHPLNDFAARVLLHESRLHGDTSLELVAENVGLLAWAREHPLEIRSYHDRASAHYHPTWLGTNRVARMVEDRVDPGEKARFRFEAAPEILTEPERFQLAFGDVFLPNTIFEIHPGWDPSLKLRELPIELTPSALREVIWQNGECQSLGTDPSLRFTLGNLQMVTAVRIRCTYVNPSDRPHFHMYWRKDSEAYTEAERFFRRSLPLTPDEQTLMVKVNCAIDELRIDPDDKPTAFRIAEVVLLVPEANGVEKS